MKAVFVFAVLALCAFALNAHKIPKFPKFQIPKVTRDDDPKIFTPADLGCQFSVEYESVVTVGGGGSESDSDSDSVSLPQEMNIQAKGSIYVAGNYSGLIAESKDIETKEAVTATTFVRPDIKDDDDDIALVNLEQREKDGKTEYTCKYHFVDKDTDATEGFISMISGPIVYDNMVKDQKWNGEKCDMYYFDAYIVLHNFCVDEDNHVIGYNMTYIGGTSMALTFSNYKSGGVSAGDFAASDKYKGCEEVKEIYEDPEDDPDCKFGAAATVKVFAAVVLAVVALLF